MGKVDYSLNSDFQSSSELLVVGFMNDEAENLHCLMLSRNRQLTKAVGVPRTASLELNFF